MYSNHPDFEYLSLLKEVLNNGVHKQDRTGTGTLELFGKQMEFDLSEGFPLLTSKKVSFRIMAEELFWFLSGSSDLKDLLDKDVKIWNMDAYRYYKENGGNLSYEDFIEYAKNSGFYMGRIYGKQWTDWNGQVDQINNVIESIKNNPNSRRHLVSAWNPSELDDMALPPCHYSFEFNVSNGKLSCKANLRSNDLFLGSPYNIASYALLTHIIADMTGLEVGKLILSIGSAHIYTNHVYQVSEQLSRVPLMSPTLEIIGHHDSIKAYTIEDLELKNYEHTGKIQAPLSVGNS